MAIKKKMDAAALKRNLFWIVLAAFVPLCGVAIALAMFGGDSKAAEDYKKSETTVKAVKSVKTAAYQAPWNAHGKKFLGHKDVIWRQAWDQQKEMYTWPDSMPAANRPLYPDDPFARDASGAKSVERDTQVRSEFRAWYAEQFEPTFLERLVSPAEYLGGAAAVVPAVAWERGTAPTQEEIWLAQEDFWVRRELLYAVRQAMDTVATFSEVKPAKEERPPAGALARRVFRNNNWEITLLFEKGENGRGVALGAGSTIKNVSVNGQTQVLANPRDTGGLPFRLVQDNTVSEFRVTGEPLAFGDSAKFNQRKALSPTDPLKPLFFEQILAWEIAPVRRVDLLATARQSHRTVTEPLKVNPELKKLEPEDKPPEADPNAPPAPMPGSQGAAAGDLSSVNKIPRERYLHVTSQCRHLPVAMRLIVDQSNIHDVLTALSNSRLRLQVTQVSFHHARDVVRPGQADAAAGTPGPPPVGGVPPMGMTGAPPAGPGPRMPVPYAGAGMRPPGGPGYPGSGAYPGGRPLYGSTAAGAGERTVATSTAQVIDNARLVELSVYAIASLYERYPPRPKPAEGATTTPGTTP